MNAPRLRLVLNLVLPLLQPLAGAFSMLTGLGHPIGAMSAASETPVTPAGYAFSIWGLLFAMQIVWGIWQALPGRRDSELARRLGWPLAAVTALNILWMLLAQLTGNGWHLVLVIALSLAATLTAFWVERRKLAGEITGMRRWLTAPMTGLLAGWVTAATFANLAGAAKATGLFPVEGIAVSLAAALVILAAGGFAAAVLTFARGSVWYAVGAGWALIAIILANAGMMRSDLIVAISAAVMLALVVVITVRERARALP